MLIFLAVGALACNDTNYNTGADWGQNCSAGLQSPINLIPSSQTSHFLFSTYPVLSNLPTDDCPASYSVDISTGSLYTKDLSGTTLVSKIKSLSFHAPSEHQIGGIQFDLEVQIQHTVLTPSNYYAVMLAFLFSSSLPDDGFFEQFFNGSSLAETVSVFNLSYLVQSDFPFSSYYVYEGSLTVPPCTEVVLWYVIGTPFGISEENLGIFKEKWADDPSFAGGNGNNRPVQDAAGRVILFKS